jgi:hypothetical protein
MRRARFWPALPLAGPAPGRPCLWPQPGAQPQKPPCFTAHSSIRNYLGNPGVRQDPGLHSIPVLPSAVPVRPAFMASKEACEAPR